MSLPQLSEVPSSFIIPWRKLLISHRDARSGDVPNYHDFESIDSLVTTSIPRALYVGTGHSIFSRALLPAITTAKNSIHFVTCFWAASPSLDGLRDALLQLAASRTRHGEPLPTLRVSIGFSSRGLLQKLFHTSSLNGHVYPPRQWPKLGLPDEKSLREGGIDLTVKSLFFNPLSVLHPKYMIVDENRAWVPSCNVSWERWFEACIELEGEVVHALLNFNARVWGVTINTAAVADARTATDPELDERRVNESQSPDVQVSDEEEMSSSTPFRDGEDWEDDRMQSATQAIRFPWIGPVATVFLPSPHHRNPTFRFFRFFSSCAEPPVTPLNAALLTLSAGARRDIHIATPNVTSQPVLDALLAALSRGVNVQIRTSKNMMLIEQLVTAGTTTSWCLRKLIQKYKNMTVRSRGSSDLEEQPVTPGKLEIYYYKQLRSRKSKEDEPVLSHMKMTMVDGEYLVLGSGNMDRASWYTSQETGFLFYMPGFQERRLWERVLEQRAEVMFRSGSE